MKGLYWILVIVVLAMLGVAFRVYLQQSDVPKKVDYCFNLPEDQQDQCFKDLERENEQRKKLIKGVTGQ
ncbi:MULTISPECIES: hypothetical protein [Pseudomonas syringae group]|uniref:Uncharacterized protein n=3 Tax=Pseudomonas syringae group TaxID=136849 RepID=A0AAE6QI56_9PSED|nr:MULTISPECIES: hypothetical protein [Pseudomonas syringae group]MCF5746694.1 hypothetical protein [Pseudomonas tremae]QGT82905.1 hypothetical protein GMO17_17870 [Pseudomonas coronafaciens pv. coronafaciens]RMS02996.1 hypothetical protein ALP74_200347 [Pseudomonas coronafaciens pv. garcae]RMS37797.1 hypothetical protein ALP71_01947 [Pseudomonas coronafaciens pv. garcae]UQB35271.1 hypothetical protein I9H09_17055 [Pseudomonas tremae]